MILWEWRRLFRQKMRYLFSKPKLTYREYAFRKTIISFSLFFVGWKMFGIAMHEKLLYRWDESIQDKRYFEVKEAKELLKKEREDLAKWDDEEGAKEIFSLPSNFKMDTD